MRALSTHRTFMYHDIRDLNETPFPKRYALRSFLRKAQFKSQIEKLKNYYEIISTNDIITPTFLSSDRQATLTFDDGLRDHFEVARFLSKNNIPATFFVPVSPVLHREIIKSHKIQLLLAVVDEPKLVQEILEDSCDLFGEDYKRITYEDYSKSRWKNNWWSRDMVFVTNFFRNSEDDLLDNLFEKYVLKKWPNVGDDLYLTEKQVKEMSEMPGITIGGHGYTSIDLTKEEYYDYEIKNSADFVKKYSEHFYFSYPNGGYNSGIINEMNRQNCKLAFTVEKKTITELDDYLYMTLPRYDAAQQLPLI